MPRLVTSPCSALSYMALARAASSMRPTFAYSSASRRYTTGSAPSASRLLVVCDRRVDPSGACQRGGETEMIGRSAGFPIDRLLPERRGAIVAALGGAQRGLFLQDIERHVATPVGQHLTLRLLDALELPRGLLRVPQPHQRGGQRISRLGVVRRQLDRAPQRRHRLVVPAGVQMNLADAGMGIRHPGDRSAARRRAPRMPRRRGPAAEAHRPGTCARPDRWGLH